MTSTPIAWAILGLAIVLEGACVSFVAPEKRFVRWADQKIALGNTIEQLGFDPAFPLGRYLADEHYLTNTEMDAEEKLIYHYASPTLRMDMICHYHLVVDRQTRKVVDWGFDQEFGDPKKTCRVAG